MDDSRNSLRLARTRIVPPEPAFDRLIDRRRRKHRNSRIASIAMAFVVLTAGIGGAVFAFGGAGAAQHGLGSSGGQGPNLVAGPGQYYYTKTQIYFGQDSGTPSTYVVSGPWTLTFWVGTDQSGRAVFADNTGPGGTTGYTWRGGPDRSYSPGTFPLEDLSNLPTDPNELTRRLTARSLAGGASPNPIATSSPGRSEQDTALLRTLQDLFNSDEEFTPPAVRSAMFDVAAGITGVETIHGAVDPVGRPAIGLRWTIQYTQTPTYVEWFFDPQTKQLMAETWTQDGRVLEARVVTEAGIADSTDAPPSSDSQFFPAAQGNPAFLRG